MDLHNIDRKVTPLKLNGPAKNPLTQHPHDLTAQQQANPPTASPQLNGRHLQQDSIDHPQQNPPWQTKARISTMTLTVPSVPTIRDSFETKPSEHMISAHPTRAEVKQLKKAVKTNLRRLPCIVPGTGKTGWAWISLTEADWDTMQQDLHPTPPPAAEDQDATNEPPPKLPEFPNITNPGMFTPDDKLTEKQHARAEAQYKQDLCLFQHMDNVIQACLQDLETAIPSELIADLCDEDDATHRSHGNQP